MRSLTFNGTLCFQSRDRHFNPISIAGSAQFSIFPAVASDFTFNTRSPPFPSLAHMHRRKQVVDVNYCIPLTRNAAGCT